MSATPAVTLSEREGEVAQLRKGQRRIYLASSWRNPYQPDAVRQLRAAGHDLYDFRNPAPGNDGFQWSEVDPDWEGWDAMTYRSLLNHPVANASFNFDFTAMEWADTCVLLLPCGRSAHLEAGYFIGAGKELYIVLAGQNEPELMYKMATGICLDMQELLTKLQARPATAGEQVTFDHPREYTCSLPNSPTPAGEEDAR
jgi:hypothetical protein